MGKNAGLDAVVNVLRVPTSDGESIVALEYLPTDVPPKGVIFINPAMGVKQTFYRGIAAFFAGRGYVVVTYDYRGVGQSLIKPIKSYQYKTSVWGEEDITAIINYIKTQYADLKVVAVSHSIGGQLLGLSRKVNDVDLVVNIAVQSGYFGLWSGWAKTKLWLLWNLLVPGLTHAFGYYPAKRLGAGENIPKGLMLEWVKWCKRKEYMFDRRGPKSVENFRNIRAPVHSISFSDDAIAPRRNVEFMNGKYPNLAQHKILDPRNCGMKHIGHFGYFREPATPLWDDLEQLIRTA